MTTDMSTLTGAYAVNALTDDEREEFERHLAHCSDCAQEVRELRETASRLGAASATAPPEDLKQRVLDEIRRTRQVPPTTGNERHLSHIPRRRSSWGTRLAVAAAVVGIALAGAFGAIALRNHNEMQDMQRQLAEGQQRSTQMAAVMAAPDAKMNTTGGTGMNATAVMSKDMGKSVFLGSSDHTPPPAHVYQLWFIGDYGFQSAGVLTEGENGRMKPMVAALPPGTTAMGVTVEPTGGSPQPTTDPVLQMTAPA